MSTSSISDAEHLATVRNGLFFIVGPHRAGTTLLQAMLSSHSAMTVPPETGFFDQVWPRRAALGSLTDASNVQKVGEFVNGPECSVSDLGIEWQDVLRGLSSMPGGYDDLFVALMSLYAQGRGKRRAGEKSPRHLFAIEEIRGRYPQAKFICLLRDPRGVVRSERETSWGSRSVCRVARRWCRVVDEATRWQRRLSPEQFQVVRYEELVSEPERILRSICEFLGEEFEPQMLQFQDRPEAERGFRSDEDWKKNTLRAVNASRSEQWRSDLSPVQIWMIERIAGSRLGQQGYAASGIQIGLLRSAVAYVGDYVVWGYEIAKGLVRGRGRRRPWRSVWREIFFGS